MPRQRLATAVDSGRDRQGRRGALASTCNCVSVVIVIAPAAVAVATAAPPAIRVDQAQEVIGTKVSVAEQQRRNRRPPLHNN